MKVQVEELSTVEKKLSIEVEAARVSEELSRAYSELSRRVRVPGFRPGKVPRHVLEQRFRPQVEEDVLQRIVQLAMLEAVQAHDVDVVGNPQISGARLQKGEPLAFEAVVEVKPKIEVKDYEGLPFTPVNTTVEDKDVEERIEQLRQSLARLEPLEGRDVAQAGDFATVDYEATVDGQPFSGSKAENTTVELAPGEIVNSQVAALEGVKVGESKKITYVFPQDYQVEQVKGKAADFVFHLKALKRKVVPALDDELARQVEKGQTLEEMRAKVRGELERDKRAFARTEERRTLLAALLERNSFAIPRALVDRRVESYVTDQLRRLERMGLDIRQLPIDLEHMRMEVRPQSELDVKRALVLEALARQLNVQVSEEEVDKRVELLASEAGQPVDAIRQFFSRPEDRRRLSLGLQEEKTIEFLKARAKYS